MTLWLRTDGTGAIGYGHVMRAATLAEAALARDMDVVLVTTEDATTAAILRRRDLRHHVTGPGTEWSGGVTGGDLVVFDGYHFTVTDFTCAADRGATVGAIDDHGEGDFPVDVLLNQNVVTGERYRISPTTQVLLGPRYALVREEFRAHRRHRSARGQHLVVTFGASDPARLSSPALHIAQASGTFEQLTLLVGPGAEVPADLPPDVAVVRDPPSVGAVFDQADAVLSASGSTTWEVLCMGLPTALVEVVDNQRHIGRALGSAGVALFIDDPARFPTALPIALATLADPARASSLSTRALETVDGEGADRFLQTLLDAP
jgi:UDP-2,4-diacetamido-2,4,6-trideoxy-beta-L-altropyranose hydrolase